MSIIVGATWTYSGDPATDDKDAVRFLVGDTNSADQRTSDEEILWCLAQRGSPLRAAAAVCRALAASEVATEEVASKSVGDLSISYEAGGGSEAWLKLADTFDARASAEDAPATPRWSGTSYQEHLDAELDTDFIRPAFRRGQFDPDPSGYDDPYDLYWRATIR